LVLPKVERCSWRSGEVDVARIPPPVGALKKEFEQTRTRNHDVFRTPVLQKAEKMKRYSFQLATSERRVYVLDAAILAPADMSEEVDCMEVPVDAQLPESEFPAVVAYGRRHSFDLVPGAPRRPRKAVHEGVLVCSGRCHP
jgi:hypothetical protein